MKQIISFSALLLFGIMFAACTKQSQSDLTGTADYTNTTGSGYNAIINYSLTLKQADPGSGLYWNSGYANVNGLLFGVTWQVGNSYHRVFYGAPVANALNLFQPAPIGSLRVPERAMDNVSFALTFAPAEAPAGYAFSLSGTYYKVIPSPAS